MLGTTNIKARSPQDRPYLVTGAAGFIGAAVSEALLRSGRRVVGVDNFSPYYDTSLKRDRIERLISHPGFELVEQSITDAELTLSLFDDCRPEVVIHLAAQPGVAHSTTEPLAYLQSNVIGTMNVLEGCRLCPAEHLLYASSSSVYGASSSLPLSIEDPADHPVSVYAATKRSNELMAHSYSHLFGLPTTGLRFFTVYGPRGRPDMAYYRFAMKLSHGEPLTIYGDGTQRRDFTYIDDIVEAILELAEQPPTSVGVDSTDEALTKQAPYRLLNLGHGEGVSVNRLIELLEENLGLSASTTHHEHPRRADLTATEANITDLRSAIGFTPSIPLEVGIKEFARWFLDYYRS